MRVSDSVSRPSGGGMLLLVAGGSGVPNAVVEAAAQSHGLDAPALRIHSSSPFVSVAGRGMAPRISGAAEALRSGGVPCAAVPETEARSLPPLQLAGGIAPDGSGAGLRVHGRPAGPPEGVPLLLVLGDIGREDGIPAPSAPRASDTVRQRILRAVFPVVDVVWSEGRIRVAVRSMAWRGLPGLSPSSPSNFLRLLEILVSASSGAVLDLGFRGQDLAVDPGPSSSERLEGGDAATALLFDRYSTAAVLAWRHGLYPPSAPGKLLIPGEAGGARTPAEIFQARPAAREKSLVPWIRRGKQSRIRGALWPWFSPPGAIVLLYFRGSPLGILVLVASGLVAIALGLRWLATRERVRALPLARIRSAAMGPVQLSGTVVPCAPLVAPYSHVRAAWYRFEIQERRGDSQSHAWNTIEEGGSGDIPFRLEDGTGSILIQPSGAEVDVPPVTTEISSDLRAVEWVIAEGSSLFVLGFAQRRDVGSGERETVLGADADEVFVGSSPDSAFLMSHRNREKETSALTRKFQALVALGFVYLVLALILWIVRPPVGD